MEASDPDGNTIYWRAEPGRTQPNRFDAGKRWRAPGTDGDAEDATGQRQQACIERTAKRCQPHTIPQAAAAKATINDFKRNIDRSDRAEQDPNDGGNARSAELRGDQNVEEGSTIPRSAFSVSPPRGPKVMAKATRATEVTDQARAESSQPVPV